ncbi:hypothetical protein L798_05804 [Zootermopsis nevadensis]|uniref:Uncharacterized protein n=1 Tax=Zootermopsis nevadensis TaxID=136037 RepID=A0A067RRX3_ZOONE|nr:hypothetical protein L798_05804 [Zootermopsis nevadensis]
MSHDRVKGKVFMDAGSDRRFPKKGRRKGGKGGVRAKGLDWEEHSLMHFLSIHISPPPCQAVGQTEVCSSPQRHPCPYPFFGMLQVPLKRRSSSTKIHGTAARNGAILLLTAVRT